MPIAAKYHRMTPEQRAKAAAAKRRWRARDPDKTREYMRQYYKDNPEKFRAYQKQRRDALGVRGRKDVQLKANFGITIEQYDQMLAQQHGGCAVCGSAPSKKALHVDHCHESGLIRGLLCSACNTALGLLRECPKRMDALKAYISNWSWLK